MRNSPISRSNQSPSRRQSRIGLKGLWHSWAGTLVPLLLLAWLTLGASSLEPLIAPLAPENAPAIYARDSFIDT